MQLRVSAAHYASPPVRAGETRASKFCVLEFAFVAFAFGATCAETREQILPAGVLRHPYGKEKGQPANQVAAALADCCQFGVHPRIVNTPLPTCLQSCSGCPLTAF